MLKKQSQPQQTQRECRYVCRVHPTLGEIDQFFAEAMRQLGTKLRLCWSNGDKTIEFLLSAVLPTKNSLAQWEFYEGTDKNAAPLWSYVTSDDTRFWFSISLPHPCARWSSAPPLVANG